MNKNSRVEIIEFVGLPGAGKTTICNAVLSFLEQRPNAYSLKVKNVSNARIKWLKKHRMSRLFSLVTHVVLCSKHLFLESLYMITRFRPVYLKDIHLMLSYPQFDMLVHKLVFQNTHIFLDQGPLQYLASVTWRLSALPISNLNRVLGQTKSRPTIIVHVECDAQTSYQRVAARPSNDSRFDLMCEDEFFKNIMMYQKAIKKIMSTYISHHSIKIITIDAHNDVDLNVSNIIRSLDGES